MTNAPETTPLDFEAWCAELDRIHTEQDGQYGPGSCVATTGKSSWEGYFEMGYSPADALAEDASYD